MIVILKQNGLKKVEIPMNNIGFKHHSIPVLAEADGIVLSEEQQKAVDAVIEFIEDSPKKYFVVSGFAGTGKSAVIPFIRENMHGDSAVVAYTGKAVVVLKRRGIDNAQTIHSFLYYTKIVKDEKTQKLHYEFHKKYESDFDGIKCVFVDESSMVDKNIFDELTSHDFKVVFFGDSFQLPPVKDDFNIMENPDIQLTQIVRQNADNPIIKLSLLARTQQKIPFGIYGESSKKPMFKFNVGDYADYDQIICWTNRKRKEVNETIRSIKGYEPLKVYPNEKMIVKHNYPSLGLYNGQMVYNLKQAEAKKLKKFDTIYDMKVVDEIAVNDIIAACDYIPLDVSGTIGWDAEMIFNYNITKSGEKSNKRLIHMDYGYAITCHASQGSSWGKICIIEEDGIKKRPEYWRWIYTAITRAEQNVTIFSSGV